MYAKYAKIRDEKGFSDLEVAKATNIAPSTIYDWKQRSEKDEQAGISLAKMALIAKLFDVPLESFV